ncbi:MAG: hypothetical protein NC223_08820 [Butyrivibrio sp.]|nr:hypothetical protein [Butyrivibrio sp.]
MIAAQLNALAGEIIFEIVRGLALAATIVLAVFLGSRLRKVYDKAKAKKEAAQEAQTAQTADADQTE